MHRNDEILFNFIGSENSTRQALGEVEDFFKSVNEIKRKEIEAPFHYICNTELVIIPEEPVSTDQLYDLNNTYRNKIGNSSTCKQCASYHSQPFRLFARQNN